MKFIDPKSDSLLLFKSFLFLISLICFSSGLYAQDFILGGGDWSTPTNWKGGIVPPNPFTGNSITVADDATVSVVNLTIGNGATLIINKDVDLTYDAGFSTFTNNGTIQNDGTLNIADNNNFSNNGEINNDGACTINSNGNFTNGSSGVLNNNGTFNQGNDGFDSFMNFGCVVNNGIFTRLVGFISQEGSNAMWKGEGRVDLRDGSRMTINGGTLSPGNSFGTMAILGDMALAAGVSLFMEIVGGGSPGNDLISVSGTLDLGGSSLTVVRTSGSFGASESWDIITAGTLSGSFGAGMVTLPSPPMGITGTFASSAVVNDYRVTYSGTAFLPVELSSFTGKALDNIIHLDWTTASETNNDYMMIERSGDGLQFQEIGRVKGYGTTVETQTYQFIDENPLNGLNYYRLRQVDFDGTEEYSNVIAVDIDMIINGIKLNLSPNPSQDLLRMAWQSSMTSEDGTIHLIEAATGKELQRFAIPQGTNQMEISVADLPQGVYVIQMIQDRQQKAVQFVKN